MIVDRRVVTMKRGHGEDAVALLKQVFDLWERKLGRVTYRIYTDKVAPFDSLAWEWECESLAEYDRLLTQFFALPELAPLMGEWSEATEAGGTHEIWNLA
jgi:hypothetical protein